MVKGTTNPRQEIKQPVLRFSALSRVKICLHLWNWYSIPVENIMVSSVISSDIFSQKGKYPSLFEQFLCLENCCIEHILLKNVWAGRYIRCNVIADRRKLGYWKVEVTTFVIQYADQGMRQTLECLLCLNFKLIWVDEMKIITKSSIVQWKKINYIADMFILSSLYICFFYFLVRWTKCVFVFPTTIYLFRIFNWAGNQVWIKSFNLNFHWKFYSLIKTLHMTFP